MPEGGQLLVEVEDELIHSTCCLFHLCVQVSAEDGEAGKASLPSQVRFRHHGDWQVQKKSGRSLGVVIDCCQLQMMLHFPHSIT